VKLRALCAPYSVANLPGHAGAIVSGSSGTAIAKKDALEAAGVKVGQTPSETARFMRAILGR